ncbi:anoctamin-10 [Hypomesus transpacificus]|uniref:anoctamin-10 n=1 Tax=Hypomesus transpacificus TaxID=137520 RepID=UPI001F082580|nr:anoctamin-10 [Hypomesus transpacificus]XP_046890515.1 anoctamin-10 [Hypomesus transpacificus]
MTTPGDVDGDDGAGRKKVGAAVLDPGAWSKVSCPCCLSDKVEPLVLIQLREEVHPDTKRWFISRIEASKKDGGAQLLAHPGEDEDGEVIVLSAPRCCLLRATEELGLCKPYSDGEMTVFSYPDRHSFKNTDDMQAFLTLAERQYIIKYELDCLRARKDLNIPGLPDDRGQLRARQNICQKLQKAGVILDIVPIHHQQTLDQLGKSWYSGTQVWGQPLDAIQAYFGGSVGFYFSFLDFYTWALVPPALVGVALMLFLPGGGATDSAKSSQPAAPEEEEAGLAMSGYMVQAVFSMVWSTIFMELWKRRSSALSHCWGVLSLAERFAEPRPGFQGTLGVNPVTKRVEPLFPEWRRQMRVGLGSLPVVVLFLGLVLLGMAGFYQGETLAKQLHQDWGSLLSGALLYLPSMLHILYTNMLSTLYGRVALKLTEWENHREESSFQNHHTAKVLMFSFFNYFAVLFHIAFYKQDLPLLRKRLSSLLIVTQLVNQCTELVVPWLVDRFLRAPQRPQLEDDSEEDKIRAQRSLPPFPGLFSEYIELLVQFGYLSLFSCVYPLTPVLLLLNNVTEIRGDAYKICKLFRKPFCAPVASMGVWQTAFEILSFVSVMSNCWLLLLSPRIREFCLEGGISGRNIMLVAILVEHILILIKMVLAFMIPDEPDWIREKREQIEFRSLQALGQQKH